MSLNFHPDPGAIVICDFNTGFQPPEMVKKRPVVIVSPRRRGSQLATVVPLSSTPPDQAQPWHFQLPVGAYPAARSPLWAKCDVVLTLALTRMDRVRQRASGGGSIYTVPQLGRRELDAIRAGIAAALAL